MVFFKRLSLSRSRSDSRSYIDQDHDSRHDSKTSSAAYDDQKYTTPGGIAASPIDNDNNQGVPASRHSNQPSSLHNAGSLHQENSTGMYPRQSQGSDIHSQGQQNNMQNQYSAQQSSANRGNNAANGYNDGNAGGYDASSPRKTEGAPELLLAAFNQALRPYNDKVEHLENEIADLNKYIAQLESQQREVHAWIDKRGLRPDVPPSIAHQMDTLTSTSSPNHAAATLNAQLDRKITIVNFDLHRLQDDLNDSLPTPSFSACMLKFLPDITRLTALPTGPRHAFDLLLKLGGNLNSHGGLENQEEDDLAERRRFYAKLDAAMVEVVRGRFAEEGDAWGVGREIKRIEKTGAYLRNWGVEPYFPRTLEVMREGSASAGGQEVGGQQQQQQQGSAGGNAVGNAPSREGSY